MDLGFAINFIVPQNYVSMLVSLLFIIFGFLGYLTALLCLIKVKSNNAINIYLVMVFVSVGTRHLTYGLSFLIDTAYLDKLIIDSNRFFVLLIPIVYLYFKKMVFPKVFFLLKDSLHFIVPILFFITISYIKIDGPENVNSTIFAFCIFAIFVIYVCAYCFLSFSLLNKEVWTKKKDFKIKSRLFHNWTKFLFLFLILASIRAVISVYLKIHNENFVSDYDFLWVSAVFWIPIYFKILLSPEILYGYNALNSIIKKDKISSLHFDFWDMNSKNTIDNLQHNKLKSIVETNILEYISKIEEKRFCHETFKTFKFTVSDFARTLNIPASHLSYLFKYHCNISFSDFKKSIRIRHSIDLIQSGYLDTNTLESLAKNIGFSTYTSFYTSFKEITGKPPREYVEQLNE
jgi:AraC-like DNA-binding protein